MGNLYLGDTVNWKGAFGTEMPKEASIVAIQFQGVEVMELNFTLLESKETIITLDNGRWAYGYQIEKI
ncbi:MAG: hypothetical protein KA278_00320 [Flavobacterium sp.]|nr:hypothetical protein [Flavobacterium sp.]